MRASDSLLIIFLPPFRVEALNLSGNHLTGTLSSGFCDIEKLGLDCDKIPCPCNACKCASGLVGGT